MISTGLRRSALGACRGRAGGPISRLRNLAPSTAVTQHEWRGVSCRHPLESRRWISVYGYTQAKALIYSRYGEPKDVLQLHKHSISAPHGTQVNLRLLAAPLNPADVNQIQGVYPSRPPFETSLGTQTPCAVAGNEGAFEVISTGSNVTNIKKGDWVVMKQTGQGTWRTHAQMDESQLIKIEDKEGLTPLQVSTVSVNPVTAYRMIKDFCDWDWMRTGEEWLIQNGANSGVGRAAIQLAREWGIKTLNVVRERKTPEETENLKQELRDLGATAVVTEAELLSGEFKNLVHELTRKGREPIRLALNCVGGKSATALAKTLAPGSHLVTYGAMSKQPVALPSGLLIFKNLAFNGFWVSKWGDKNPQLKENTINDVLQLTRAGKFKDIPVEELKWRWNSEGAELLAGVQETLSGFRSGKGLLRYEAED
ncbi:enoyl-[acyl-carrier-protein] reductase [Aspergillus homomorphus CBS 101889]|uniref:enoyl-[acyl-carrier-protein] reductase n=1 Tax=Aspergillus homomorphus (strain CBS 101889) TaxID=1450537 RepID=A0A395I8F3_ASPHC|nr:mitochondrial enoyl reductase [Aspergillus homomorphus CBS 101889]RAL15318.1 mitochondrial enoyl reductase [Aspergillus homomorphus CBS 101889]